MAAGTINLCRPIRRRRLIAPVFLSGLMMAILIVSISFSFIELIKLESAEWDEYAFWLILGTSWLIWGIVFYLKYIETERFSTLKKLITTIIAGSLIELLAAVPSHVIVSRRPGCLVGIFTALGISGGILVMFWAFGPGILLIFLHDRYKTEQNQKP